MQTDVVQFKLLDALKKEMELQYDLTFQYKQKNDTVVITVVAPADEQWKSIEEDLLKAEIKKVSWKPDDYDLLAKIVFMKKEISIPKFKVMHFSNAFSYILG